MCVWVWVWGGGVGGHKIGMGCKYGEERKTGIVEEGGKVTFNEKGDRIDLKKVHKFSRS